MMPYYVYKVTKGSTGDVKGLDFLDQFTTYKDAKSYTRSQRAEIEDSRVRIKMIFANDQDEAEGRMSESREEPILREWEK